jgi:hypothetical protein
MHIITIAAGMAAAAGLVQGSKGPRKKSAGWEALE